MEAQTGTTTGYVYGRVYDTGVTEPGVRRAACARSSAGGAVREPEYESGWTWINAGYNMQIGYNDEYYGAITAPAPGSYRYVYRFSRDEGVS